MVFINISYDNYEFKKYLNKRSDATEAEFEQYIKNKYIKKSGVDSDILNINNVGFFDEESLIKIDISE